MAKTDSKTKKDGKHGGYRQSRAGRCSPSLVVTQDNRGRFECVRDGDCGACVAGHGASVLEAVGSWAIYAQAVAIRCDPPAVLKEFSIADEHEQLTFRPVPSRD